MGSEDRLCTDKCGGGDHGDISVATSGGGGENALSSGVKQLDGSIAQTRANKLLGGGGNRIIGSSAMRRT